MIAGCIGKRSRQSCTGCERREACARPWPQALGFLQRSQRRQAGGRVAPETNPFLAFLGDVAKAVEARADGRSAGPPASPFRGKVERRIEALLESGDVGIDRVARDLGFGRQTLYRRLKAEGITYERLLDGLRRRLALRFLREGLPVKDAAYRLGFSDPAAFSRAFKRWTGTSPSGMRRKP